MFVLIFIFSRNLTTAFITAILFGIHPMHVEPVAWISARKEVLYSIFFLSAIVSYVKYVHKSTELKYYYFSFVLFCFSILSKASAASLPLVLLLIDYFLNRKFSKKVLSEKTPFFIIAIVFGILSVFAQQASKSIQVGSTFNFIDRIIFACYGLVNYFIKLAIPTNLSALYLYPEKIDGYLPNYFLLYPIVVILIIALMRMSLKHSKKTLFGALFFLITIFMVLQFIPVGRAIMADRYSYIPSIGLFFILAEGFYNFREKLKKRSYFLFILLYIIIGSYVFWLSISSWERCKIWKDGTTLWSDVLENDWNNPGHYNQRGQAYLALQNYAYALHDFNKAIELKNDYADAYIGRGVTYVALSKHADALSDFTKAAILDPYSAAAFYNKGYSCVNLGRFEEAVAAYSDAIELKNDYGEAYVNRGVAYFQLGDKSSACHDLQYALETLQFEPAKQFYDEICR